MVQKFAKMAAKKGKIIDIKHNIINQPNLTLQLNNTIMNYPLTHRVCSKIQKFMLKLISLLLLFIGRNRQK